MILKKAIHTTKQWIFNNGSQPFQVRVMTADEIGNIQHYHKTMHEYFYIVRGTMSLSVNSQIIQMKQDDLVVVEPGEPHVVTETTPDLLLMLIMPPPVPNDKVIIDRS